MTDWLKIARDSFEASTSYVDSNYRKAWERNLSLFQSRHPSGSKYNTPEFRHRSRLFVPKTRSVVRKNEAAAAAAFFANVDVLDVEAENDADPMQMASAAMLKELLNYRLQKTIPWFVTLMGAIQSAQVMGLVASYQYWKFKEKEYTVLEPMLDDMGQPLMDPDGRMYASEVTKTEIIEDKPCCELIPFENIRFDPAADWTDIVGSSPYLIRIVPMYLDDVKGKMAEGKWKRFSDEEIKQALTDYDTTRQTRENRREDPIQDNNAPLSEYTLVFCHENFVRLGGEEKVYWTLGTQRLLSEPVDLKKAYFHGERPIVIGGVVIEAHKAVPDSLVAIGSELQREQNDLRNQRMDNVKLVLNKRWIGKRGKQIDVPSLLKNVPGAVTLTDDPESDLKEIVWPDVTASSYQEQDRLNIDFDELMGNFSQSSVLTNRKLNETVGGMELMDSGASMLTEYLLRTFVETWAEPVLRQLVKLEQRYESDLTILGLMGQRAQLPQKYGIDQITDELLNQSLTVRVNIGPGATDPNKKMARLMAAIRAAGEASQILPSADQEAIQREIFGLAGYRNPQRFFQPNQASQMLMAQLQEMQQALQELSQQVNEQKLQLANKQGELQVKAFEAETNRIEAVKPEAPQMQEGMQPVEVIQAFAQVRDTEAATRLKDAQTVKTMTEARLAPFQAQQQAKAAQMKAQQKPSK